MKLMISADIEGTCGICNWDETDKNHPDYAYFAKQMTKETGALCEGALETGKVEHIYIKDAHESARNIIPGMLPEAISIMRGWQGQPCNMMAGMEGCDGVAMVGYHSAAGTDASPLSHTGNRDNIVVKINGQIASEFMLNTYFAAYYHVPVLFVSGDKAICEEAKRICPNIETVAVSEGRGNASLSIHPHVAVQRIKKGIKRALERELSDYRITLPEKFEVEVQFREIVKAQKGSFYPGAKRSGPRSVSFVSEDYYEVARFFYFVL